MAFAERTTTGEVDQDYRIELRGEVLQTFKERIQRGEVPLRKEVVTENKTVEVVHQAVLVIFKRAIEVRPHQQAIVRGCRTEELLGKMGISESRPKHGYAIRQDQVFVVFAKVMAKMAQRQILVGIQGGPRGKRDHNRNTSRWLLRPVHWRNHSR